jgi:hypothetical protein
MMMSFICSCRNKKKEPSSIYTLRKVRTITPVSAYWRDLGLDEPYHTFAAILQSNRVSPHQVLLDADIDSFRHPDAGHALARAAANYPTRTPPTTTPRDFFFSVLLLGA